ncbi:hypothetical protein HK100_005639 [Physocladia obscura]|uniref:C2 domain-containing protein n=1 Tax=Physocladia obscura TaxID=109957 RepID=A0AAD5SRG2_9FUNG|nr:hypothetical protein HK100_005639 [Physocladia obscura]
MSHFTDFQIRRFRFIFNQHSEGAITNAVVTKTNVSNESTDQNSSTNYPLNHQNGINSNATTFDNDASWLLKISFKLTAMELVQLMPRFGPQINIVQARDFIYEYDTSCTGCLDFDDFIEFLGDYQAILHVKREKAVKYYTERSNAAQTPDVPGGRPWDVNDPVSHDNSKVLIARHFIKKFPDPIQYLASLYLDDPEFFFTKTESLTTQIMNTGIINDMNILKRSILVRVYAARNLVSFARIKKRTKKGIEFASLDAMIRIEVAGIVQQTSAVMGTVKPDWDQDLKFDITIPPGETHDVMQWVDRQVMVISLLDLQDSQFSAVNTEVIAQSSIPLLKILMSVKKPMWQVVKLNPVDCVTDVAILPCLELSIADNTREQWAWAKIMDAYSPPEEVWFQKHPLKVINDLKAFQKGSNRS